METTPEGFGEIGKLCHLTFQCLHVVLLTKVSKGLTKPHTSDYTENGNATLTSMCYHRNEESASLLHSKDVVARKDDFSASQSLVEDFEEESKGLLPLLESQNRIEKPRKRLRKIISNEMRMFTSITMNGILQLRQQRL